MTVSDSSRPIVLVFHKLLTGLTCGITNYSPRRFESLLQAILSGNLPGSPNSDHVPDKQGRGVIVSFDDGYQHLVEVLPPLMERLSFRAVIFIPTGLIGKMNRWDYSYYFRKTPHLDRSAIRFLVAAGAGVGSHGVSHRDLTSCSALELQHELENSRKALEDLTGRVVDQVSYPFGRYNERVIQAAREAGYRSGYTIRLPRSDDDSLALGRVPIYAFDTPSSVCGKLSPGIRQKVERFKTDTVNRLSGGTVWLNRLRRFHT